jgi:hydroxymethylglutaryl-CoA reductase (NADPH)
MDIFENGPRPVQASLKLLSDEEVVVLAQAGKIAAYALEKLLGDLERAVRIRRALICEFFFFGVERKADAFG